MKLNGQYSAFVGVNAKIYTLSDSFGNIFYIGCTINSVVSRLSQHISAAKRNRKYSNPIKNKKITDLDFNIVATVAHVQWITGSTELEVRDKIRALEQEWILKYQNSGCTLLNGQCIKQRKLPVIEKELVGQSYKASRERIIQR